ncbi:nucleotidyltransferase family protein [uncultured Methanospirillum sp.]|uniref:nucleotidyltransferase family protein n=1 Tax=uncultured Methanospirillum sp. TaxID=262503 RepID=UPI0029C7797B|nr:nucleotidyltransferase family protein [uncultured Methanospirillum sp.]
MAERDEIVSILKREVMGVRGRFGVKRIGLFGSIVRNEGDNTSDIDLIVEFDPSLVSYKKYLDLETYLQSLFPRPIEIVTTDGVSPYILPYISREVVWV